MGLRFKKSVTLMPGVKLNIGKTGVSVSAGGHGYRKTIHSSGRVTTSVGIPGTGLYYVDTRNPQKQNQQSRTSSREYRATQEYYDEPRYNDNFQSHEEDYTLAEDNHMEAQISEINDSVNTNETVKQIDVNSLKSIHKAADDSLDWTEVLVPEEAPDETYNQQMWSYYHSIAPKILSGDIDAYLQVISEVNPLNDLLMYGSNFEFGTDDPRKIEVKFDVNTSALSDAKRTMSTKDYNLLLQDYICSVCIRVARDMFALLPVKNTKVHVTMDEITIISVDFDRAKLSKVKFGYIDPSDTLEQFRHNMDFNSFTGFSEVDTLN